tara:strand:+ start:1036 stop:1476 length:441 start_codon:yes stop_codon:yes gene_type:complete
MNKFRDTKIGKILSEKAPKILDVVGDLLPDKGLLGVVKNLVNNEPTLSTEDKAQIHQQLVQLYKLEVQDRDSARKREVEMVKAGASDWMMNLTGVTGLFCFVFIVYSVVYIPTVSENDLFVHLMGMIEGVVIGNIFAFYYGTSSKK